MFVLQTMHGIGIPRKRGDPNELPKHTLILMKR